MKDCLRGGGGYDGIILSHQIMLSVCFHNGPRTRSSFRGLRCVLVAGLKLTALQGLVILYSPQRCGMGTAINGGHYVSYQQQNNSGCVLAFLLSLQPLNQISTRLIFLFPC